MALANEKSSIVVIDTNGDTVLTLKDPLEKLQDWKEDFFDESNHDSSDLESESGPKLAARASKIVQTTKEYEYRVSSVLLKNASGYFRNIFSNGFSEATADPEDGKYHISVQGFHPKALEHVMNIIHVKTKQIPRKVDLEILAHVAVLVDYYDMKEAVEFHAEIWTEAMAKQKLPEMYCKELVLRTFVAKVFGNQSSYQRGAQYVVWECKEPVQDLGLPLLGLAEVLEERRCEAIQVVVDHIKALPNNIRNGKYGCCDACKTMLLGHFTMKCCVVGISGHRLDKIESPYRGLSYASLRLQLALCSEPPSWSLYKCSTYAQEHTCNLFDFVGGALAAGNKALWKDFDT